MDWITLRGTPAEHACVSALRQKLRVLTPSSPSFFTDCPKRLICAWTGPVLADIPLHGESKIRFVWIPLERRRPLGFPLNQRWL